MAVPAKRRADELSDAGPSKRAKHSEELFAAGSLLGLAATAASLQELDGNDHSSAGKARSEQLQTSIAQLPPNDATYAKQFLGPVAIPSKGSVQSLVSETDKLQRFMCHPIASAQSTANEVPQPNGAVHSNGTSSAPSTGPQRQEGIPLSSMPFYSVPEHPKQQHQPGNDSYQPLGRPIMFANSPSVVRTAVHASGAGVASGSASYVVAPHGSAHSTVPPVLTSPGIPSGLVLPPLPDEIMNAARTT